VLARKRNLVWTNANSNENFPMLMEATECIAGFLKGIRTYRISSYKIAEVEECCNTLHHF
jgi:hypothetical protein